MFDYGVPAELFMAKRKGGARQPLGYRRFATEAEAIRFAFEDISAPALLGACLEVDEVRFGHHEIHCLYEDAAYPLKRCESELASDAQQLMAKDASLPAPRTSQAEFLG